MIKTKLIDDLYSITSDNGYKKELNLRKGQLESIKKIDDNFMENFLFVAPTAYGKTIISIHYIIKVINSGLKVVYTAPLKALTAEVVEKLHEMGFKVLEDTGDYRKNPEKDYQKCDVLITTYERLDAVIRNPKNHQVFDQFGLVVIDEVHTIHSESRGVNLESLIVKIKYHTAMTIMAMSATVDNYEMMSDFLGSDFVYVPAEDRPVKQKIEVMYYHSEYHSASMQERNNMLRPIFNDLIRRNKQALIFCSSRKRCETLAKEFSNIRSRDPVELASKSNYTWHHAGVPAFDKKEIERMFMNNQVRFIFCTPTLAMGVNLPAYCVVIYDTCRWNGLVSDNVPIESIEIEQMVGRAGRPQFGETECEVFIFSRIQDKPYTFHENIVKSKMFDELKAVLNEWCCSGINQPEEIKECIKETFLSREFDLEVLNKAGGKAMSYLVNNGFVNVNIYGDEKQFDPSFLGRMTALFYIRPETALHYKLIESVYNERKYSDLELTAMLLNTEEFLELIRVEDRDAKLIDICHTAFHEEEITYELYDERIMKAIPMIFTDYFNKKYGINIILYRTDANVLSAIMERLLSSAEVIIFDKELKQRIKDLMVMIKNRTLDKNVAILRSVKGLGDVRLNRLFGAGIKKPEEFFRKTDAQLMKILKVSENVLKNIKISLKETIKSRG